jgi:peptidoglycan/LPS O-acetylase OafA/YrhL
LVRLPNANRFLSLKSIGLPILAMPLLLPWITGGITTPLAFVCAAISFAAIAAGNDLFGLLTLRSVRVIGTLSYSIYLLHMLILFCGLGVLNHVVAVGHMEYPGFSAVVFVAVFVIGAISMLSYRFIEKPWMKA